MRPKVAIIGAGWAGLAAAVELAPDCQLTLYEAGREPGGRARCLSMTSGRWDNGQHILLGAYHECLRLMRQVGVDTEQALLRLSLRWQRQGGIQLQCPRWPAPWHLLAGMLSAQGLSWLEKWQLLRALQYLKRRRWRLPQDMSVSQWLALHQQSAKLIAVFWRPLVLSSMNTPLAQASMQVLANVLRDSLGAKASASDLLLPKVDLSALFPAPAWQWLQQQGANLQAGHRVQMLQEEGGKLRVDQQVYDAVIVAVAPYHAAKLLPDTDLVSELKQYQYWPIYTVYLQFAQPPCLPSTLCAVQNGCADWLFDRSALVGETGVVAGVLSAPDHLGDTTHAALVQGVLEDIQRLDPQLGPLISSQVIVEKRATFASVVNRPLVKQTMACNGLFLAGDYVAADYPATLEGAVRSGVQAAAAVKTFLSG